MQGGCQSVTRLFELYNLLKDNEKCIGGGQHRAGSGRSADRDRFRLWECPHYLLGGRDARNAKAPSPDERERAPRCPPRPECLPSFPQWNGTPRPWDDSRIYDRRIQWNGASRGIRAHLNDTSVREVNLTPGARAECTSSPHELRGINLSVNERRPGGGAAYPGRREIKNRRRARSEVFNLSTSYPRCLSGKYFTRIVVSMKIRGQGPPCAQQ